ncbi:hypothetical protein IID22_04400 [Patescibacteria group bacterium]|nr:hypothetical protein [Patescibacteria group bacterium]
MEERFCGSRACLGKETGNCAIAEQIRYQAKHGSNLPEGSHVWRRKTWGNFIRNSRRVLANCARPDQLRSAINTVQPTFVEDLQKT